MSNPSVCIQLLPPERSSWLEDAVRTQHLDNWLKIEYVCIQEERMRELTISVNQRPNGAAVIQPIQNLLAARAPTYRELAYGLIKEAILTGQLESGQPLVEERLASMLNISRTPVREALAILEHEGLLTSMYRRGLYVTQLTREAFVDLFVANETVEPDLARRAALNASEEELATMAVAIEDGERVTEQGDVAGFLRSGRTFHRLVGAAAGNPPLMHFVERNEERVDLYLMSYGKVLDVEGMRASNREHAAILKFITQHDPDGAARLVVYHAQATRERWAELFTASDEVVPA